MAQQAVSRDIQRLEHDLGVVLFDRSTRQVRLTPDGAALLQRAQDLLAMHDAIIDEIGDTRPLVVDVVGEHLTPHLVVRAARDDGADIIIRTGGGLAAALPRLLAGDLDVAFGHVDPARLAPKIQHRIVRDEPLGILVPQDHHLAGATSVPVSKLRGMTIDTSAGNPDATEWTELAATFLASCGAQPASPHRHVVGAEETARHLTARGMPILSHTTITQIPGAVLVRLIDPAPTYRWRMLWRRSQRHPSLIALHGVVDRVRAARNEPTAVEWSVPR
ncbi:MAG: LysR family transcriptional regulator [Nocardioidaceae bacterium]